MRRIPLIFLLLVSQSLFAAKPPEISPEDAFSTLRQMMDSHVYHKQLSPVLIQRALEHYLEGLDPTKTYFLEKEVEGWLHPVPAALEEIKEALESSNFSTFLEIHSHMLAAIQRRNCLEKKLESLPLPENVNIDEFKEVSWAQTEEQLLERLLRIKALQTQAAQKLDEESREKALQRIVKKRLSREDELATVNSEERLHHILSYTLKAFASSFDAHTAYFTPAEAAQFMVQVQQRLLGIGVQLRDDLNGFTIVKILEGGPASQNTGLMVNDRIIAINEEPIVGLETLEVVELIRGEEGSPLFLTVLRGANEKHEIKITRGEVILKEARISSTTIPFGEGVIAHISLHTFYQDPLHSSSSDLYEEISKIRKDSPLKGIILDLRFNSGGVLPQAVAVAGLFIAKGIVVSIKDNNGTIEHLRNIEGRTTYDGPLLILTSKASASAAEIVAQTLQDYGRAILVGDDHTYGKGTFQIFTLDGSNQGKINPKGELKVTRGRYYTISGKSPQLVGVEPDLLVPGFYSAMEIGERHSKNALETDTIPENFYDDLSDLPPAQRDQVGWLYRFNAQSRLKIFTRHLPILKKNSEFRLANDPFYQSFLVNLENEKIETPQLEAYIQNDPQLKETVNIMKDLILLLK